MNDPVAEHKSTSCPPRPSVVATGLRAVAVGAALACGVIACGRPPAARSEAAPPALGAVRPARHVPVVAARNPSTQHFMSYALNALLVPLLDDDWPPRWVDPSLAFDCDAGDVTVDGEALDVGAPVQQGSFTVRWRMQRCAPFDHLVELSGDIELRVDARDRNFSAIVRPVGLRVRSSYGEDTLNESFTRLMYVGR